MSKLNENALYTATHPEQGTWYFTDLSYMAKALHTNVSNLKYTLNVSKYKTFKGWYIELNNNCGKICYEFINKENILERRGLFMMNRNFG